MIEVLRTNNTVALTFAQALLDDSGIEAVIGDHHIAVIEGSIGAFPRRLLVHAEDLDQARELRAEAEIGPLG